MANKGLFLRSGQYLVVGDNLTSRTGQFTAEVQTDGNLVVKRQPGDIVVWSTENGGIYGDYIAVMKADGNLVVYPGTDPGYTGAALWESGTGGRPIGDYITILQDDGRFAVYEGSDPNNPGQQLWGARAWIPLTNNPAVSHPPFYPDTMLLLTDGTVLCQDSGTPHWWQLRPDMFGSYINGTWSQLAATQTITFDPQVRLSRSPALIPYHIAQQDLLFCIHEGQRENGELWYTTFDGTTWALDEHIPNVGTTGGPGLAVFHDSLYCAHQGYGASGELWYTTFDANSGAWAMDRHIPNVGMSGSPALIVYQGLLYCIHEGKGNSGQLWYTTYDGSSSTWAPDQFIPNVGTTGGPGLAVFNFGGRDLLCCAHQGYGASGELWFTTFDGTNWSQDRFIGNVGISESPALIVYQNNLYCVHEGKGNSGQLWFLLDFEADQFIPNVGTTGGPGLAVFNLGGRDLLCCAHQGYGASGELWFTTFDGTNWSQDRLVGPDNPTPYAPSDYASAVLADGRVFVAGGEYLKIHGVRAQMIEALVAQIYDPTRNDWTNIPTPNGWKSIGDAPCCVLPDGRLLLGSIDNTATAIYDPTQNMWTAGPDKHARSAEETWTLLPDNTVLTVECVNPPNCEKYVVATNQWVSAGQTPVDIVEVASSEIGPAILLPDGRAFVIGATGNTVLYTLPAQNGTDPGFWITGPRFPQGKDASQQLQQLGAKDTPACLLPNGKVWCAVGPVDGKEESFLGPTYFYEYDPNLLTQMVTAVPDPPNLTLYDQFGNPTFLPPSAGRLLLLPTGQVLFANNAFPNVIAVLTPNGTYDTAWRPMIIDCPTTLSIGQTYTLKGTQLNGLSQACSYGDDAAMATNYPLVRIRNLIDNTIGYCRTSNHSTMGVATGTTLQSTRFFVRPGIELGLAELTVIANGIPSAPRQVTIVSPGT